MKSVIIPKSVTKIGDFAFYDSGVETLYMMSSTPPSLGMDSFYGINTIYVPYGSLETYKSIYSWNKYSNRLKEFDPSTIDNNPETEPSHDGSTASLTVGSTGMATYCSSRALDFSGVSGIRAYVAAGFNPDNGKLLLMHVDEVPASTGLLIKGAAGSYDIPVKATNFYYLNLLKPVFTATTIAEQSDGCVNYVLANGEDGLLFWHV